jgi:hypothetical protein
MVTHAFFYGEIETYVRLAKGLKGCDGWKERLWHGNYGVHSEVGSVLQ